MEEILAYSVTEKKKLPLVDKIEFRQSPNGSYMIKGKGANGKTMTTMIGKDNAKKFIEEGATVVKDFTY